MSSIQRPKAFTFIGSDGIKYPFLAKAGDDLSLDARVSELFRLFDHFLANDKKSRELNLSLRSYFVVPLGEKKGLIEWIPNLKGFKDCCKPIYTREGRGQYMEWKTDWKGPDILRMKVKISREIQVFLDQLIHKGMAYRKCEKYSRGSKSQRFFDLKIFKF